MVCEYEKPAIKDENHEPEAVNAFFFRYLDQRLCFRVIFSILIPMAIPKTILVVDDDNALRFVIVAALKKAGYTTIEATDGLQGIAQAIRTRPHLIISDVYMDSMNGFIMVETLKEDENTSSIPVIMMTSAAQAAGAWDTSLADDYIDKGFSMPELVERVRKILK